MGGTLAAVLCLGPGCATVPPVAMRAARYHIAVSLDPQGHSLKGRTTIDMVRTDATPSAGGPVSIEVWLHPDLVVTGVRASGAELGLPAVTRVSDAPVGEQEFRPARYRIVLSRPVDAMTVFVEYEGELHQDVAAGEKPGEIHNFTMRAHIGEEGVYLADGYWYPQPAHEENALRLADFTLVADAPVGFELVASGEKDSALRERTGRSAWCSPYPLPSMVLVGGPHQVHRDRHGDIDLAVHLRPSQSQHAPGLLAAIKRILDRYEPLIGPYPAREYAVVDNFFSSGFAFPCFTLLSSAVIDMGERAANTHGYLDHEMLHSWWGNGVFVDPGDGDWCEALTSYATNYYGHVLDGDEEEARRKRRNYSHFFSRLKPEDDRPLGTFGLPGGCNRQIAYDKGAMVFHMLARQMGQDRFWSAMRRFNDEYLGRHASWDDIRETCERESNLDFQSFFQQWVRSSGIASTAGSDPDYHFLRHVALEEIVPTTAATRRGPALVVVLPTGGVQEAYVATQAVFESSYAAAKRIVRAAGSIEGGALADRCVLILGGAVRDPYVEGFLRAIEFPVGWTSEAFEFEGKAYNSPGDAVLCTSRHPGVPGGGVTVLYANSDAAIPRASAVPMYEHSLVIFRDGRPVLRRDFERPNVVRGEHE
jgi:hypothetical protein